MIEPGTIHASKTTRWGNVFSPNQTDGVLLVSVWLILVTALTACVGSYFVPGLSANEVVWFPCAASVVGCLAALATAIGWGRQTKGTSWFLFALCTLASFALGYLILWLSPELVFGGNLNFGPSLSIIVTSGLLALFAAILALTLLLRWVPILVLRMLGFDRQKTMIGAAAVLLLLGVLQNALFPNGVWLHIYESALLSGIFTTVFEFVFLMFVPGWAISNRKRWWVVLLTLLPLLGVVGYSFTNAANYYRNPYAIITAACTTIASVVFVVTLLAIRTHKDIVGSDSIAPDRKLVLPSVWSFLMFSLLLSGAIGSFSFSKNYDVEALISPYMNNSWKITQELSRRSGQLLRGSNNQIRLVRDGRSVRYECKFTDATRPDILDVFNNRDNGIFQLENMNVTIDTSFLRSSTKGFEVIEGEITPQQIDDLVYIASFLRLKHVKIVQPAPIVALGPVTRLIIDSFEPGQIKNLFKSFKTIHESVWIYILDQPRLEDWPAIVDASQKNKFVLYQGLSKEILQSNIVVPQSLKGIRIFLNERDLSSPLVMKFILQNDVTVCVSPYDMGNFVNCDRFYDLLFAKHGEFVLSTEVDTGRTSGDHFEETMNRHHNSFGWNEKGQITEICIPGGCDEIGLEDLTELTTLSFDPRWLIPKIEFFRSSPLLLNIDLTKFTKLERLYFPMNRIFRSHESGRDIGFLGELTSLNHLQISCDSVYGDPLSGFEKIKNLESLTLSGLPAKTVVSEIGSLKKLKKLTIVDNSGTTTSTAWLAQTKKLLPGVTIVVIKGSDWKPDLPPSFVDHVKKLKITLRKTLLDEIRD